MNWPPHDVRPLALEAFDERFRRYRLISLADQKQMAASLLRDGQLRRSSFVNWSRRTC